MTIMFNLHCAYTVLAQCQRICLHESPVSGVIWYRFLHLKQNSHPEMGPIILLSSTYIFSLPILLEVFSIYSYTLVEPN